MDLLVGAPCCTAKPVLVAAEGWGSSYSKTRQEGVVLAVQGASWGRGRGWQTEEGCVIEDCPSQACLIMVGLEETSRMWVAGQAGKNW